MNSGAAGACASLLADGIQLIKDDDVKTTVGPQLKVQQGEISFWKGGRGAEDPINVSLFSAPPLHLQTVCGCWPRTPPRTCSGSLGRLQPSALEHWASCRSAWPSVFSHIRAVRTAGSPWRAYSLKSTDRKKGKQVTSSPAIRTLTCDLKLLKIPVIFPSDFDFWFGYLYNLFSSDNSSSMYQDLTSDHQITQKPLSNETLGRNFEQMLERRSDETCQPSTSCVKGFRVMEWEKNTWRESR